jgi:hypothetical protein
MVSPKVQVFLPIAVSRWAKRNSVSVSSGNMKKRTT